MIYVLVAIVVLLIILVLLIASIVRQRRKYSELHAMYSNGDGGLGEHASIQEWQRLADASLAHSRARRKNGAANG
jgi:preprotein translocase subunit SecG